MELLALAPEVQSMICLVYRIAFQKKNERKNTLPASFMQSTLLQILPEKITLTTIPPSPLSRPHYHIL
jgi:hypothetical protein